MILTILVLVGRLKVSHGRAPQSRPAGAVGWAGRGRGGIYLLSRAWVGGLVLPGSRSEGAGGARLVWPGLGHLTGTLLTKKLLPSQLAGNQRLFDGTRGTTMDA